MVGDQNVNFCYDGLRDDRYYCDRNAVKEIVDKEDAKSLLMKHITNR